MAGFAHRDLPAGRPVAPDSLVAAPASSRGARRGECARHVARLCVAGALVRDRVGGGSGWTQAGAAAQQVSMPGILRACWSSSRAQTLASAAILAIRSCFPSMPSMACIVLRAQISRRCRRPRQHVGIPRGRRDGVEWRDGRSARRRQTLRDLEPEPHMSGAETGRGQAAASRRSSTCFARKRGRRLRS